MAEKTVSMHSLFNRSGFRFGHEYFIFLLPIFFVLHGYTDHFGDIPGKDAFFLALEYVSYVLVFSLGFALILRTFRKGAVYSFLLFSFYFFFGAVHDAAKEALRDSFLVTYSFVLPAAFFSFLALLLYVKKAKRSFHRLTRYLNIVLLVLMIIDVVLLTMKPVAAQPITSKVKVPTPAPEVRLATTGFVDYPDIHLIIADEYAGRTALQEVFGFDNTPFEDSLRRRGFYLMENSRSNYNYTVASMASLFQMEYLPNLTDKPADEIYKLSKNLIRQNSFARQLQAKGYTIRNFSVFEVLDQAPFAEPYFPQNLNLITRNTFFARVKNDIGYHAALTFKVHSELEKVKASLRWEAEAESRKMDSVIKEVNKPWSTPRFFYTHLMMPHAPYHQDKNGNLLRLELLVHPQKKLVEDTLYLKYLEHANEKLLHFIDSIQAASVKPPVMLLLSDHGYRGEGMPVSYHFNNLAAVSLPGRSYKGLYSGLSNVNQLRLLLNKQFGKHLSLQKDSSIYLGPKNGIRLTL